MEQIHGHLHRLVTALTDITDQTITWLWREEMTS